MRTDTATSFCTVAGTSTVASSYRVTGFSISISFVTAWGFSTCTSTSSVYVFCTVTSRSTGTAFSMVSVCVTVRGFCMRQHGHERQHLRQHTQCWAVTAQACVMRKQARKSTLSFRYLVCALHMR